MILGVLSDTHKDKMNALPYIIAEFKKQDVHTIIHCGDILSQHLKAELFGNLPVICALTDEQVRENKPELTTAPPGWTFTQPDKRIVDLEDVRIYVGHKRAFEFLYGSETKLLQTLNTIRRDHDMVRYLFSGHTHHQIFMQNPLIHFINPGAVENSIGRWRGYEYAIVDTEDERIVFARIPATISSKKPLTLGIISDSLDISQVDREFWKLLAEEFDQQNVTHIIHCGNIALEDIGRPELNKFEVYFNLRPDQKCFDKAKNWHLISSQDNVVIIEGYHFYVCYNLGADLLDKSEIDMYRLSLNVQGQYPETEFILFGFTHNGFYEEGENMIILNPGDVVKDRNFAIITLPKNEITFDHIPLKSLTPLKKEPGIYA
ncbi:MAG: metallophosphoesterase family protein [bacterium]